MFSGAKKPWDGKPILTRARNCPLCRLRMSVPQDEFAILDYNASYASFTDLKNLSKAIAVLPEYSQQCVWPLQSENATAPAPHSAPASLL